MLKIQKGFSLLELLTLLAIIIILSSLAISSMIKWINRAKVKTFAEQLLSDIQWARSLSLKYSSSKIQFLSGGYKIYAPLDTIRKSINSPENITITDNLSSDLEFKANTLPNENGTIIISGYGKTYRIIINLNGEVRLE